MYTELAHLYDWPGALDFAEKIRARVIDVLQAEGMRPPARIVDLACGTGTLAIALAQAGYNILGIELSEPMLAQARRKHTDLQTALKDAGTSGQTLKLAFQQGDMRTFLLPEIWQADGEDALLQPETQALSVLSENSLPPGKRLPDNGTPDHLADMVLCHYDSLNHLSNETELRATFLHVAQALKPGGLFLFDLNTLDNFRTFWNGSDTDEGPNYRIKTSSRFDENLGKAEVTFAVDEYTEDGELLHRAETLYEQYFNEMAVEKYLMAADFFEIQFEAFNPVDEIPADFPLKTFWRCKKRL